MKGTCRVPGDVIGTEPWSMPRGSVGKQIGWGSKLGKTAGHERFSQPSALEEELTPDHDGLPCHANKGAGLVIFRARGAPKGFETAWHDGVGMCGEWGGKG